MGEFALWGGVNYITFAKGLPIQPVSLVEDDLMNFRLASGALRRAKDNTDPRLHFDSFLSSKHNRRMHISIGEFPRPDFPRFHLVIPRGGSFGCSGGSLDLVPRRVRFSFIGLS